VAAVQKAMVRLLTADFLLQHGPAALAPMIKGGLIQFVIFFLFVKVFFVSTHVCCTVDCSFLESNRAVVIDLCDGVWTITFQLLF
jgi:hypothetical protein